MAKRIAVFADGTGNSAAKLFKTNVWRLYDALDTSTPPPPGQMRQIAYYHDGVGTSSFKPLAILGGAFGWGLKRNVLDLYMFLCRNYERDDTIYAFGFSRGAFTVRILAAMVVTQGLVVDSSDGELEIYARDAYRAYRRRFNQTGGLVTLLRNVRDIALRAWRWLTGRPTYEARQKNPATRNHDVKVTFLGVWDTVAAYGMPIAEMTRGIDDWVWPLSMPNYQLSDKVLRARHALALDDERDTFHPLLWDERPETDSKRLQQVWFAGMHSDVGGGYPDDSLAYVSLSWMLKEAEAPGVELRFQAGAVAEITRVMNANGALHDSRRGVGATYRYQPRKIAAHVVDPDPTTLLMQDPNPTTSAYLKSVKIHDSVFERIQHGTGRYAPIVLPATYEVVATGGGTLPPREVGTADERATAQERVWDRVWHKRLNYFATMVVATYLASLPLWHVWWPPTGCVGPHCLLSSAIYAVGLLMPAVAQPWIDAFAAAPGHSVVVIGVLMVLLGRSRAQQTRTRDDMRALWERSLALRRVTTPPPMPRAWIRRLRSRRLYQRFFQSLKWSILPTVFGIAMLGAVIVLIAAPLGLAVLRADIWLAERANRWCPEDADATFTTEMKCWPLPYSLEKGSEYRLKLTVAVPWVDRSIDTTVPGFGPARMTFFGNLLAPLRRSVSAQWFQPMLKIRQPDRRFVIVPLEMQRVDTSSPLYVAHFTAPRTGRAYFFVNDVVLPRWIWDPDRFYENNVGSATIEIECVGPPPVAAPPPAGTRPIFSCETATARR